MIMTTQQKINLLNKFELEATTMTRILDILVADGSLGIDELDAHKLSCSINDIKRCAFSALGRLPPEQRRSATARTEL